MYSYVAEHRSTRSHKYVFATPKALALIVLLAGCGESSGTAIDTPQQDYPPVVQRSEPYNAAPGTDGQVLFKNNFDHQIDLAHTLQKQSMPCSGVRGREILKLAPNAEATLAVGPNEKLCFSMGRDLAKPLSVGICEARGAERIALAAYAGCYRL
jgi:hypothetical protein